MKRTAIPLLAVLGSFALSTALAGAETSCPATIGVGQGETLESLAQRCGVNAEALKQANPGSHIGRPRAGTFVEVPARPLPSPTVSNSGNPAISSPPAGALSRDPGVALRKTYPGTLADRPPLPKPPRPPLAQTNRPWELPRPLWAPKEPPFLQGL